MAKSKYWGSLGFTVLAALASPSAMAGSNVTITFGTDAPVPLDHWSSVLAFGMIAIAAYFLLRRQGTSGRLWQWVMAAVVAGAGTYGLGQYDLINSAHAAYLNLMTQSPFYGYAACDSTPYPFTNGTGQTIRITGVTWGGVGNSCQPGDPTPATPQCAPGLSLAPNAGCFLQLNDLGSA